MTAYVLAVATAFWLGVLTSISPCPMATNIAAVSYVARRVDRPRWVVLAGLLYTVGRTLTYLVLGVLLVNSLLSAPGLSHILQKYMNLALGPLLILVGMVLLNLIPMPSFGGGGVGEGLQRRVDAMGVWGAGLLGVVFALSFYPTSAALFFGSLLPLALEHESGVMMPAVYGVATGLPVLVFALLLAAGTHRVAKAYNRVVAFERWARVVTGVLFILVGVYYCLTHIFGVSI
jgi:cytochrome c-type biogenesis protein